MQRNYKATRLCFKKAVIDLLGPGEVLHIETPEGVYGITRRQFETEFANVLASASYQKGGIYSYATTPRKAFQFLSGAKPHVVAPPPHSRSKYPLPEVLSGKVAHADYRKWIHVKAAAHVKRDKKRWNRSLTISSYKQAIHQAVLQHDGSDPYTGEALQWELLRTYNNECSKLGRSKYKRTFRLLPTIDHVDNDPCDAPVFVVLSWEANAAKNDMTHDSFVELCKKVAARK